TRGSRRRSCNTPSRPVRTRSRLRSNATAADRGFARHLVVSADDLPVGALGEPAQRRVVHGALDRLDAAVAEDALAAPGAMAAEPLEVLADGNGVLAVTKDVQNEREGGGRGIAHHGRRTGRPAENPGELAVVDAAVLVPAPALAEADVFFPDQERVARAVQD